MQWSDDIEELSRPLRKRPRRSLNYDEDEIGNCLAFLCKNDIMFVTFMVVV